MISKKVLQLSLPEIGKIKIGMKGKVMTSRGGKKFQPPSKLDHFLITKLDRDGSGNFVKDEKMHKLIGSDTPKEIPIMLMFNDVEANIQTRLVCYNGKKVWCSGDGESAQQATMVDNQLNYSVRNKVACPCKRLEQDHKGKDRCKPSGRLSCLIKGAEIVGGCWVLRTTSWNTIQSILGSLHFIKSITNGELAGIPLVLRLNPKQVTTPDNKSMTAQIVSILYKGEITQLRQLALANATERVTAKIDIRQVEQQLLSSLTEEDVTPTDADYIDEFQPEQHEDDIPEVGKTESTGDTKKAKTGETEKADDKKKKAEEKNKSDAAKKIKADALKKKIAEEAAAALKKEKEDAEDGEFDFESNTKAPDNKPAEDVVTETEDETPPPDEDPEQEVAPPIESDGGIDDFGFGDD